MATIEDMFAGFLHNIRPDENAVLYAQEAHKPVRDYLAGDSSIKDYIDSTFLYGSYKRHTAVGDIKDVDIVLVTRFSPNNPQHSPQRVLKLLKAALTRFYDDADSTEYQRRSIRVNDPVPNQARRETNTRHYSCHRSRRARMPSPGARPRVGSLDQKPPQRPHCIQLPV